MRSGPSKVNKFGGPQTVPEGQQDHGGVAMAPAVVLSRLNQPLDLSLRQVPRGTDKRALGLRTGKALAGQFCCDAQVQGSAQIFSCHG